MIQNTMPGRYSRFQAMAHDTLIANRALKLHTYILEYSNLLEIFTELRNGRLLDVGCGGGQVAIRLKERFPHLNLTGIDTSEVMINRARSRAQNKGYTIQFYVADAEALPLPDSSFNVVYSFGSAKHWPHPLKGFSECWRILKPGGELLIADATSDATTQEIENFVEIAGFPNLLKKPLARILSRLMFQRAQSVEYYRKIASELQMPLGTVSHLPSMPAFIFRTRKPVP